jgi:molybdopterin-guanine dinucleotide biosynthesis protein
VLLLALRRHRSSLKEASVKAVQVPEAMLTRQLWRVSAAAVERIQRQARLQRGASVVLSGLCLGCLTLCGISPRAEPRGAVLAATCVASGYWLLLGGGIALARIGGPAASSVSQAHPPPADDGRLPVTVVTGFLGAGKSTLVQRILREAHGMRLLVIENELGEEGIDHELLLQGGKEEIVLLRNGCLCCSVREDLRTTLRALLPRAGTLDGVVIETTGVARPAPVIQTFLHDADLRERMRLDCVVAVVDSYHAQRYLAPEGGGDDGGGESDLDRTRIEQIAFADRHQRRIASSLTAGVHSDTN